jgi:hypothetical protein
MLLQLGMLLPGVVSSRADAAPYDRLAVRGVASGAFVGVLLLAMIAVLVWRLVR